MNGVLLVKLGVGIAVSAGVGQVIGNVILATTPAGISVARKVLVVIGGMALTATVGDLVGTFVGDQVGMIIEVRNALKAISSQIKTDAEEEDNTADA